MATMTHGVFSGASLIRPFSSEGEASRFAARLTRPSAHPARWADVAVRPIRWVRDDRYTAGGRFVVR
jgi:hypothetical protein